MLGPEFGEVLEAAIRKDEVAFTRLWREYQPILLRYLYIVTGGTAEDVASEVWFEVSRGLARFRGTEDQFRSWLYTTARRRVIDLRRYQERRRVVLTGDLEGLDRAAGDETVTAALERLSTDAALDLIRRLPSDQAEIIVLRYLAGLNATWVGQIVGKSPGAVRVAALRGLRTLADMLTEGDRPLTADDRGGATT